MVILYVVKLDIEHINILYILVNNAGTYFIKRNFAVNGLS
jgi:hypothetical protein